jgi:hypothetical protein
MVIFDVPPSPRDNYKTWEEGSVPAVIFDMTSEGTRNQDQNDKKSSTNSLKSKNTGYLTPRVNGLQNN